MIGAAMGAMGGGGMSASSGASSGTGDSVMGPIDQGGPVVNFGMPAANTGLSGINVQQLAIVGAAVAVVWMISKRR